MNGRAAFIIGYPIGHSISPQIHNAAFEQAGLDVRYSARQVAPSDLPTMIAELRLPSVLGANVTVPHKEAAISLVDEVDATAAAIGALNTIHNRGGRLLATNTDAIGFARSLAEAGIEIGGASVLLLGAGGSARAVAHVVLASRAARLLIANRHLARAQQLAALLRRHFPGAEVDAAALDALSAMQTARYRLLVNTTTVGMGSDASPLSAGLLPDRGAVVDIIYNPPHTKLLSDARQAGLRTLNGLPMLVHQAAAAWELWTGQAAPLAAMVAAAQQALGQSEGVESGR